MGWTFVKDISEILGTLATALYFFIRLMLSMNKRDVLTNEKLVKMQKDIDGLEHSKADRKVTELLHEALREDLVEIKQGNQQMAGSMERMNKSLSTMEGTLKTALEFIKPNNFRS